MNVNLSRDMVNSLLSTIATIQPKTNKQGYNVDHGSYDQYMLQDFKNILLDMIREFQSKDQNLEQKTNKILGTEYPFINDADADNDEAL